MGREPTPLTITKPMIRYHQVEAWIATNLTEIAVYSPVVTALAMQKVQFEFLIPAFSHTVADRS